MKCSLWLNDIEAIEISLDGVPGDNRKGLGIGDFFLNLFKGVLPGVFRGVFPGVLNKSNAISSPDIGIEDVFRGVFTGVLGSDNTSALDSSDIWNKDIFRGVKDIFCGVFSGVLERSSPYIWFNKAFRGVFTGVLKRSSPDIWIDPEGVFNSNPLKLKESVDEILLCFFGVFAFFEGLLDD